MNDVGAAALERWAEAAYVAALFAVDPVGTAGVSLRSLAGGARDRWLALLRDLLPAAAPLRRVPLHIGDERLLGGLDLAATLRAGRPVAQRGVLAEADGGVVLLAMAERLGAAGAARLAAVLDTQVVAMEREGLARRLPARLGIVALDESMDTDERVPPALLDRLAFHVALDTASARDEALAAARWRRDDVLAARELLPRVEVDDDIVQALCAAALALGIASLRAPVLALRVARAAAALDGRCAVSEGDAALAARLVLAPRATRLPATAVPEQEDAPGAEAEPATAVDGDGDASAEQQDGDTDERPADLDELVLEAARAALPPGLLAALALGQAAQLRAKGAGRAGALQPSGLRGRPVGARRGEPRTGARLNVIETLRAAAPWQRLRQAGTTGAGARIQVRREDFHVTRFKQRSETTTIFAVDASGSAALHRLAEAKGAVELLLADCYVRRDNVAVLAFRGSKAELLLPPTRSLVRAKRSLAGLPGGGGTPLAAGIEAALALAEAVRRRGETPVVVLLTDGRANIARDGEPGRTRAGEDALAAARQLQAAGVTALLLDTSPQPQATARQLAAQMGAAYLPLPHAGAAELSQAVRLATAPAAPR
ncbi:magnesium chelatase ATPase subunit D [Methylibium sp. Pch-M]|uniref:magnesium chelatase subunit D n=1 Tax=Methylibium sp. Pch-M TaxID=2082386 RepID=UPI0010114EAB|nr:magnesium chelatase subunit D [Methylibium sp. Pch-M]QAZ38588.1 magnesium chelatase ATPase subunit D [Methylibium sp. Pch-M]